MEKMLFGMGIVALALLVAGCTQAGPQATSTPQGTVTPIAGIAQVAIRDSAFSPSEVTIKAGASVKWTNFDSATHTIKAESFGSGDIENGNSFTINFNTPGTFGYTCGIHPEMAGKVIVEP